MRGLALTVPPSASLTAPLSALIISILLPARLAGSPFGTKRVEFVFEGGLGILIKYSNIQTAALSSEHQS